MANIEVRDGDGLEKFLKATGAGTDGDPFVREILESNSSAILADTANLDVNIAAILADTAAMDTAVGTVNTNIAAMLADTAAMDSNLSTLAGAVSGSEIQIDIVGALPAGDNNIGNFDIASIAAGETHIGKVAGNTVGFPGITATYTRPADTTAYTAGDALSDSTSAPNDLEFTGCSRVNAGSGYITGARLEISNTSFDGKLRLFLYRSAPTATNDNAALTLANDADFVGWVEFDSANIESTFGTTVAYIEGTFPGNRILPFTCDSGDTKLYGIVGVVTGFTPTSGGTFEFFLATEQN